MSIVIIGAGFAGLAAADVLIANGVDVDIYETHPYWGGHAHSVKVEGFTFDEGPHVSFTKDDEIKRLFARGAGQVEHIRARITNYYHGHWVEHPAQVHLHGLESDFISSCIADMARAQVDPPTIRTYADWCRAAYGDSFAQHFPFSYTRKYWTVEADRLSTDWIGSRMYAPTLEEVVRGALEPAQSGNFHYLSDFRYPRRGGYQAFTQALVHEEAMKLGNAVVSIDHLNSTLRLGDGTTAGYEKLISTMPLPELIEAIEDVPVEVRRAAAELLCTSVVLIDVAINRPDLSNHHWLYVYDDDISFSRMSFPHMLSPENSPSGCGSIQVEVYHSRHRALPCSAELLPERVVDELVQLGSIANASEVLWARHREVPYANVVFDHQRSKALEMVLPWLDSVGILVAGRYGEWGYHWTDDATRSGWAAARRVLEASA